jgi:signal transduction histidine kinase
LSNALALAFAVVTHIINSGAKMSYLRSSGQEQCEHILANFDRQVAKKSAEIGQLMYDFSMKDQQLQQYENNLENMARQIEFLAG